LHLYFVMNDDDHPLPSKVPPEFGLDPKPQLTQYYRQKIIEYIGHPPPFSADELVKASKKYNMRHPEINPQLFRSIVGVTKKNDKNDKNDNELKRRKEEYLAFQRALLSFDTESQQAQISSFWNQPTSSFRAPTSPFRAPTSPFRAPTSPFRAPTSPFRAPTSPFRLAPTTSLSPLVPTTGSIEEKIAELMAIRDKTKSKIVKAAYENQIDELQTQLRRQQQQGPPGNGGGKKYKKCFTNKKRRYKKRSKSIKK
jgi:hypothetical protein